MSAAQASGTFCSLPLALQRASAHFRWSHESVAGCAALAGESASAPALAATDSGAVFPAPVLALGWPPAGPFSSVSVKGDFSAARHAAGA